MTIYLPIAEMPVNALLIFGLSALVGCVSGVVGVGGGFIMTPILLFMGLPSPVAVATELSQVTAASVSGALSYFRRRLLDVRMAACLTLGGLVGGFWGLRIFNAALAAGGIDALIRMSFVVLLSGVGALMLWESLTALRRKAKGAPLSKRRVRTFAHRLPLRLRFPRSGLYISVLPPLAIGAGVGVIGAIMGVGGGFILAPAMLYLLRMPAAVVAGTSLLVVLVTTAQLTLQHAIDNQSVDLVLAGLLISGGVIGAQLGVRIGLRMSPERLRASLAVLMLGAGLALLVGMLTPPAERFSLQG